jgi:endonuclease-3
VTNAKTAEKVVQILSKRYPSKGMVDMGKAEDTLIATLLSARTTDVQVLRVYPGLRRAFPTLAALAKAPVTVIASKISSIGLYRNKSKAVKALAQKLIADFGGKVPRTIDELVTLPGVGRKTASCVLAYAFKIPAIAVDTHVYRIVHRLGWVKGKTAEQVEMELRKLVPEHSWIDINRSMVQFGRDICKPGTPQCYRCPVAKWCAYPNKTKV